ncbi:hypothetical protein WS61_21610 [Burkholderia sp. ABCPW 11]|uniref:hypothetical protein n=1 Tax=Burkholderia sp. ABCPW 11 TaxID=1637859 RepID=UPI00075BEFCE|nr:hypothetical protein [Burkholderia sp. ABCPW 11]KVD39146.1 hypothetical protein WS61_21610 [Burkholderia sp. ABCPW 11]
MTVRYITLGLVQMLLIATAGWLRRLAWPDIDFLDGPGDWSLIIRLSFYCLAGWLATVVLAIAFAVSDKRNRSMIVLFLVVTLPSVELLTLLSFAW